MAIRMDEILALDSFCGSKVIAGASGLQHSIDNLHILEITDILTEIPPNTLVFSTLYPVLNNEAQVTNVIQRFHDMGVTGLALKLNRQGEHVPQAILEQADALSIPILLLPSGGNFSQQSNEILKYQLESNVRELRERNRIHSLLLDIMLKRQEYDILRDTLAEILGYPATLYDLRHTPLPDSAPEPGAPKLSDLPEQYRKALKQNEREPFQILPYGENCLCVYTVRNHWERIGYIVLEVGRDYALTAFERMVIEQFATVFAIIYHRQSALSEMEKRYHDEYIFDLISGKILSLSDAVTRARRLNWQLTFPAVMVGISLPGKHRTTFLAEVKNLEETLRARFAGSHDVLLVASYESNVLCLLSSPFTNQTETILELLKKVLIDNHMEQSYLGVSLDFNQVEGAAKAYGEVKLALQVARDLRAQSAVFYEKLGIYRVIHTSENRREAYRFCMDTLSPILEYDQAHKTDLYTTLKVLLEADGNLKAAAKTMYIHYNTMRNRFQRIELLLGKKLSKLSAYQDIYMAVRIFEIFSPDTN